PVIKSVKPVLKNQVKINDFLVDLKKIYQNEPLYGLNEKLDKKSNVFQTLADNQALLVIRDVLPESTFNETKFFPFAIDYKNFKRLYHTISAWFPSCTQSLIKTNYFDFDIISSLYLNCDLTELQISIFYERENFLWIPEDDFQNKKKLFNDKPRAFKKFETKKIKFFIYEFNVVEDLSKFWYQYKNSEFVECNFEEGDFNLEKNNNEAISKRQIVLEMLLNVRDLAESEKKDFWIVGQSLTEWYHNCDFVFNSNFVNIGILAQDFDSNLKKSLKNFVINSKNLNDTRGVRLQKSGLFMDINFFYEFNNTHFCFEYQQDRNKNQMFWPKFTKLCTAQILRENFLVPCEIIL
ncbi:fukutin isoform X1, partial [Brachionus plicatilis]